MNETFLPVTLPDLKSIQRYLTAHRRHEIFAISSDGQGAPISHDDHEVVCRILRTLGTLAWLELNDDQHTPGICSVCGCSERDACPPGCAWATTKETLCSTCMAACDSTLKVAPDAHRSLEELWSLEDQHPPLVG